MKKFLVVLVLAVFIAGGAFGFSIGGGVAGDFNTMINTIPNGGELKTSMFGVYIFLDFSFMEVNAIFGTTEADGKSDLSTLNFSGLLKLPIPLGFLTLFPAVGVDLFSAYDQKKMDENGFAETFSDNMKFGFLAGGGLDIAFGKLFIRAQVYLTFRIPSKEEALTIADNTMDRFSTGVKFMLGAGFKLF